MTNLKDHVWHKLGELLDQLEPRAECLGLAVSGGTDSRVLFELLKDYPMPIQVLHVDHGLRPSSQAEAKIVQQLAKMHDIPCTVYSYTSEDYALLPARGIEDQARILRYRAFDQWLAQGNRAIALAHHADDQAETVLLQVFRGTSLDGLGGMHEIRGRYLRPLLDVRRRELETYLASLGIEAIEDESNQSLEMTRNQLRLELIPQLDAIFQRDVTPNLLRLSTLAREQQALLRALIRTHYAPYLRGINDVYKVYPKANPALAKAILHEVIPQKDLTYQHYEVMAQLSQQNELKHVDLPHFVFTTAYGFYTWGKDSSETTERIIQRLRLDYPQLAQQDLLALERKEADHFGNWYVQEIEKQEPSEGVWALQIPTDIVADLHWETLESLNGERRQRLQRRMKKLGVPAPIREHLPILFHQEQWIWIPGFKIKWSERGPLTIQWLQQAAHNTLYLSTMEELEETEEQDE